MNIENIPTEWTILKKVEEKTIKKWEMLGLLYGVPDEEKPFLTQLLENQEQVVISGLSKNSNIKDYQSILFPIVRKVWPNLTERTKRNIMYMPAGLIFKRDEDKIKSAPIISESVEYAIGDYSNKSLSWFEEEAEKAQAVSDMLIEEFKDKDFIPYILISYYEERQRVDSNNIDIFVMSRSAEFPEE